MTAASDDPSTSIKDSPLLKVVASIQKAISKEFLWVVLAVVLSVPLAFIVNYLINVFANEEIKTIIMSETKSKSTFSGSYLLSFAGIYFSRMVVTAIKTQLATIKGK